MTDVGYRGHRPVKFVSLSRAAICLLNFTALLGKMGKSPGARVQCRVWEIDRVSFIVCYLPLSFRAGVRIQFRPYTSLNLAKKSNLVSVCFVSFPQFFWINILNLWNKLFKNSILLFANSIKKVKFITSILLTPDRAIYSQLPACYLKFQPSRSIILNLIHFSLNFQSLFSIFSMELGEKNFALF